jgi:Rhodopsin-like GPCR transmembrane domain
MKLEFEKIHTTIFGDLINQRMICWSTSRFSVLPILLLIVSIAESRRTSGEFVLSGVNSEQTLSSFALSPYARGWFDVTLSSPTLYENEQNLKLYYFTDENWNQVLRATTCEEKVKLAKDSRPIRFEYMRSPIDQWQFIVSSPLDQERESRPHYWYFVVADCSLEYQYRDGRIPKITYSINIWNDVSGLPNSKQPVNHTHTNNKNIMSHLSADETGIVSIHYMTFCFSGLIAFLMALYIAIRIVQTHSLHLAFFLVMAAACLDSSSSLCEILHLRAYEKNGYGWYFMDALSSHFEAMCDALVSLVLLAIGSGWTLPSDAIHVTSVQTTWIQSLTSKLRNPIMAILSLDLGGVLAVVIVASHMILAQWGRIYNDDFDSYHDLEHLPGRLLMGFRILLGLIMMAVIIQTKRACPPSLQGFYTVLGFIGTLWFQGLPLVTWLCTRFVPFYLRHPAVTWYGSLCQTVAIVLLAWLVTAHSSSSFHNISRMQSKGERDLTDSLSRTTGIGGKSLGAAEMQWKIGKSKIRFD